MSRRPNTAEARDWPSDTPKIHQRAPFTQSTANVAASKDGRWRGPVRSLRRSRVMAGSGLPRMAQSFAARMSFDGRREGGSKIALWLGIVSGM